MVRDRELRISTYDDWVSGEIGDAGGKGAFITAVEEVEGVDGMNPKYYIDNENTATKNWTVIDYVREEVSRQGHDIHALDGIERVGWMLDAWSYALDNRNRKPENSDVVEIGRRVEREANRSGIRDCRVWVGSRPCPGPDAVPHLLIGLFAKRDELKPWDFYRAFLEIHPFKDGNGRTAKILKAWKDGDLLSPEFPPADFWGRPIRNP